MINPQQLNEIVKSLLNALPQGVKQFNSDLEKNFRGVLQAAFARLDLVTREEFDAQVQVLATTRAKLEELAQQVAQLTPNHPDDKT